jgi:hypothetical protein
MKNKKFLIGMPVLLIAALFFLGCPTDSDDETGDNPSVDEPVVVNALALTSYVGKPVTGGDPDSAVSAEAEQYTGTIAWAGALAADGTFAAGTVYTATVALTAATGFTFDGIAANAFSYAGAASVTNPAGTGKGLAVTVRFPVTLQEGGGLNPVTSLALAPFIGKPVTGGNPDGAVSASAEQYSGAVAWAGELAEDGTFAAGAVYTATVTLNAAEGYTFAGLPANAFGYTGATAVTSPAGTSGTLTVTIVFPVTVEPGLVDALELEGSLTAPETGAAPDTVFTSPNSDQYTGGPVSWSPDPPGGKFAGSAAYTATVTLTAKDGYVFAGAGSFAYGSLAVNQTANADLTVTVSVTFGATEAAVVSELNLTGLVAAPVKGASAPKNVAGAQYSGTVAWNAPLVGTQFGAATAYTATVILAPLPGYTFAGFSGTFYHNGGTVAQEDVNEPADTVEVTVTFAGTDASEATATVEFDPLYVTSSTGSLEGIELVRGGGAAATVKLTVLANSSYKLGSVKWYVDGNSAALKGKDGVSGNALTLNAANYGVRESDHHVTVTAKADGKLYSVVVPFKVAAPAGN